MLRALSRVTSQTRNTISTFTPPKMTSLTLLAVSAWATLRKKWIPTSDELLATSEHAVLSHLTSPFRSYMVKIDGNVVASKEKELMINTIHLQKQYGNNSPDDTHTSSNIASTHVDNANPESHDVTLSSTSTSTTAPIVLLHGYGAGVGLWFMNLDDLADDYDDVYAIDFLGCGRSSRPSFHPKTVTETETFFVESLEAWRRSVGLSRMILTGHSFGGYMASVYALRYPQHVERLVLVSPMGIPPAALFDDNRYNKLSFGGRTMYNIFNALWWLDVTPQSIVRWLGPYGSGPVTNYVNKRFLDNMPDKNAVATYCYHLCAAPGSGEYALMRLLSSRIQAYDPLNKRLHQLADANRHVPTTFIYGTSDWMFSQEAVSVVNQLRTQARTRAAAQLIRIHDAGHQLMLDNPLGFRDAMRIATGKGSETDKVMVS